MANELKQSARQTMYRNPPQAYFLIGATMNRAHSKDWDQILDPIQLEGRDRMERAIKAKLREADIRQAIALQAGAKPNTQKWAPPVSRSNKYTFWGYRQATSEVAPTTFVCGRCNYVTSLRDKCARGLKKEDLVCPICKNMLSQVVHIFGHSVCGQIEEILPLRKPCETCGKQYRLIIENADFGKSRWQCPNGHKKDLVMYCKDCQAAGAPEAEARMAPYAAGSAVKPLSLTNVDIDASANWEDVARQRLQMSGDALIEAMLDRYKNDSFALGIIKARLQTEAGRNQAVEEFLANNPQFRDMQGDLERIIGGPPDFTIKVQLAEYGGVDAQTRRAKANPLKPYFRKKILERYHLVPRYTPALPLLEMIYGYQVGSSRTARIRTFGRGYDSVVLCHRATTEAALFDVDPDALAKWVGRKLRVELDKVELQRRLLLKDSAAYREVEKLLHTISHLMIKQSELYTGLSRESLSEIILPSAMAFLIYASDGSELGALRSAFASYRLSDWLGRSLEASQICTLDPSCRSGRMSETAACHSCLYLAERICNGYWNSQLDRRSISNKEEGNGFWDF